MSILRAFRAPNLINAPQQYETRHHDQVYRELRVYFNTVDNGFSNLFGPICLGRLVATTCRFRMDRFLIQLIRPTAIPRVRTLSASAVQTLAKAFLFKIGQSRLLEASPLRL
jgi:hypothetical protein